MTFKLLRWPRLRAVVVLAAPTGAGAVLSDFRLQFGNHHVGLLTGDVTVNRDAWVMFMTKEVYRNMLYGPDATEATEHLFAVVLDEFHHLNQPDRGTVWEESFISSPSHVCLVALPTTIANAEDVRD
eukprot:IDg4198t1